MTKLTEKQLSILGDNVIEGGEEVWCNPPLMVNPENFGFPVVHVDIVKFHAAWKNTALAIQPNGLNCMGSMAWMSQVKMPMFMPFAENIYGDLDEGNHTFSILYNQGYGDFLDILVRPDIEAEFRATFGAERKAPNPLSGDFLEVHGESVILGLNLVSKGAVVDGFVKQENACLNGTCVWTRDGNDVDSEYLLLNADRSSVLWMAQGPLKLYVRQQLDLNTWVASTAKKQAQMLQMQFPMTMRNAKGPAAYR